MKNETCKERIGDHLKGRIEDLQALYAAYLSGDEYTEDGESLDEYGLGFDYVPKGTFKNQRAGFFRYQLSFGGPSDGFRFYCDAERNVYKVEYVFLDWFDGATRTLRGGREKLLINIFTDFFQSGKHLELNAAY